MNEFETNPEQALRGELQLVELRLAEVQRQFSEIPDGKYENNSLLKMEIDALEAESTKLRRKTYNLLLALNEVEIIKQTLTEKAEEAVALFGDATEYKEDEEIITASIEIILDDAYAISAEEPLDPRVDAIAKELVEKYGLTTFEAKDEE